MVEDGGTGDVVNDDGNVRISDVTWDKTAETFLSSGVPELEANGLLIVGDRLGYKVDSDGGLGQSLSGRGLGDNVVFAFERIVVEAVDDRCFAD